MMDERERRDIMLRAIHRYGEAAQIDMAVEEDKLRRLLGRLNSYAESNLHEWLHQQYKPGIWSRTVDAGAQPCEGGAPDE